MTSAAISNYVHQLYQNVLLRNADGTGATNWGSKAEGGMTSMDLVKTFVSSSEAQNVTALLRLYDVFFDRAADAGGLFYWLNKQKSGMSIQEIASNYANSSEFQAKYGGVPTAQYVDALYSNLFERASDAAGNAYWANLIDTGKLSRTEVAVTFAFTPEAVSATGAATRFAESYLVLRSSGVTDPATAVVEALAQKSLTDAITEVQTIRGTVQNGILQNASVFRDMNGDGLPDIGATPVTTDSNGKFTIVGGYGDIVVTGGTDQTTGKFNDKVLATPASKAIGSVADLAAETMVTPLTTIVKALTDQGLTVSEAIQKVNIALGLDGAINPLTFNHTAAATTSGTSEANQKAAVAVKGAVAQLTTIMEVTAGLIKGAAIGSAALDAATITTSVAGALADKIIVATVNATTTQSTALVALESNTVIKDIINASATKARGSNAATMTSDVVTRIGTLASDAAQVIGAVNTTVKNSVSAINNAETFDATQIVDAFSSIAKAEALAQDTIQQAITTAAFTGSLTTVTSSYTGSNLSTAIKSAEIGPITFGVNSTSGGTIIDQATSSTTPTSPSGSGAFTVTETGGVVSFSGTATGNISIAWSGAAGSSVATFARGGVTATKTANFGGTAKSISLSSGQVLASSAANVAGVTITGAGSVALSDTNITSATLTTLDAAISATLNASAATKITGTAAQLAAVAGAAGITKPAAFTAQPTAGSMAAADLTAIDNVNTNAVDATLATVITGTAAQVAAVAASAGVTKAANFTTILTAGSMAASDLIAIDAATTTAVEATSATTITGTAAQIAAVVAASGITRAANFTATVSGSAAATDLNAIDAATTTAVNASAVTAITGTAAQIAAVVAATGITKASNFTATLTAGSMAAADLTAIDSATTSAVNATAATAITGTAAQIAAIVAAAGITRPAGFTAQPTAGSMAAADLLAIDSANTTAVNASLATEITGTAAEIAAVATAIGNGTITHGGNWNAAPTWSLTVAQFTNIDSRNGTGTITYRLEDSASAIATAIGSTGAAAFSGATSIVHTNLGTTATATGTASVSDTFVFATRAGITTPTAISNFVIGSDKLGFTAFIGGGSLGDHVIDLAYVSGTPTYYGAAGKATLVKTDATSGGDGSLVFGDFGGGRLADISGKEVVIVYGDTGTLANAKVYYVDSAGGGAAGSVDNPGDIVLVGTLTGFNTSATGWNASTGLVGGSLENLA